jgi:hypothetical protein
MNALNAAFASTAEHTIGWSSDTQLVQADST